MITRALYRLLLALTLMGILSTAAAAQETGDWEAVGGPTAFVTHIAIDPQAPDFLFTFISNSASRNPDQTQTAQGDISVSWAPYFSVDGGTHWEAASNQLAGLHPTVLKIFDYDAGSILWVGTKANGLWQSDNGGRSWKSVTVEGLENQQIVGLVQDAHHRLHLLTLDNTRYPDSHLFTSSDGGHTWHHRLLQAYSGEPDTLVTGIIADPFDWNRLYVTTVGGLLMTKSAGYTWQRASLPLPEGTAAAGIVVLTPDPTQRGRLYLVRRTNDLYQPKWKLLTFRSNDGGETWQTLPSVFTSLPGINLKANPVPISLKTDPLTRGQLLLTTDCGLWLSPDGGESWRMAGVELAGASLRDIVFHPRNRGQWLVVGAGGVWRSTSMGSKWELVTDGLPAASSIHQIITLHDKSETLLALNGGLLPDSVLNHPLWRSNNGGISWKLARRGLEGVSVRELISYPAEPGVAFALTDSGFARTDDAGISWLHREIDEYPLAMAADPFSPHLYLATAKGLLLSDNKGDSWTRVFDKGSVVAVAVGAKRIVWLVGYDEGGALKLWQSKDYGQHWRDVGDLPAAGAVKLHAHHRLPGLLALTAPWHGIFVSTDGGQTWGHRDKGIPIAARWRGGAPDLPPGPNILALFIDPETGIWWASRDGGGIYRSLNNGFSWQDATEDMGDTLVFGFAHGPDAIMAGTSNLGVVHWQEEPGPIIPPAAVDMRIEIFWPHDFAPVTEAKLANIGVRVYRSQSLEPPPCAWDPNVEIWGAQDAEPLRKLGIADHLNVEGHPFPFWQMNDLDVAWANEPPHQLIYMARMAPGLAQNYGSVWIHAADARTWQPQPPAPTGLAPAGVSEIDGRITVVWPHDESGQYASPDVASKVNIRAVLFQRDTLLALDAADLPSRLWLVGALDNQVGRRLAVGSPIQVEGAGFRYTAYDFNDIDVSQVRDPRHHWSFWLEAPSLDMTSNVWVHGSDPRTMIPRVVEPISGCLP